MKSQKFFSLLLGMFMLLLAQSAQSQVQTARYISITPNTKAFYEYLPQGYDPSGSKKYPLIVFLHGMGELGDGSPAKLPLVLRNGPPKLINNGTFPKTFTVNSQTFSFVVLSPQFVDWPSSNDVDAVISYAIANYNADPSRIYITGLSMGGGATWDYAGNEINLAYPKRVAAIVPIAGASYPSVYKGGIMAANGVAVWALHNDGDPTAPVFYTNDYVKYINASIPAPNPPAKKTIFSSTSHDAWTKAYDPNYREDGKNVYEWMLQYSKGSAPSNPPPVVNAGADKTVSLPTNSIQLSGSATDPNGSVTSYAWTKVTGPSQYTFSSMTGNSITVTNLVQGTYTFRLTATDNQGALGTDDITVVVSAPPPPPGSKLVKVNIYGGTSPYTNTEWNNWNTYSSFSSGSLKYNDGTPSSVTASISQQSSVTDNGTYANSTMAPVEVLRFTSYSTSNRTLTISGLDNSKTYDLEIYGSRKGNSNNTSRFTVGATNIDVKTDDNVDTKASFISVTPVSGQITVSIAKLNTYNYINGFMLIEKGGTGSTNVPPVVNAGLDQSITLPASSLQLNGSATDANGSVSTYSWSKVSGPAQFTFSSTTITNPIVSNLAQGSYTFRLTATDNQGASASDDIIVVVGSGSTPPVTKTVKVNVFGGTNPYSNSEWNNWNSAASSGNLKYTDGSASSISAAFNQQSGVSDNGTVSSTMAPSEVVRHASYSTSNRTLTISGLDNSKTYNLEIYASRKGTSNNTSRFTIGATSIDVKTDDNLTNAASFTSLVPSGGQITVSISKLNAYNYVNGFTLTETSGGTTSVAAKSVSESQVAVAALDVYPNPVQDRFVLQVNNDVTGQMKVQIVDISGVTQREFTLAKNQAGSTQTYLSIGDLPQGEYVVRVQIGDWTESTKISKL
jgi:hypothetical protein